MKILNALTDALLTKINGITAGAEVNNISDLDATDLTDGGETSLHTHALPPHPAVFITARRETDQTFSSEVILGLESAETYASNGMSVDGSGSVATGVDGKFYAWVSFRCDETSDPEMWMWVEKYTLATTSWGLVDGSLSKFKVKDDTTVVQVHAPIDLLDGDKVRFKLQATSGSIKLESYTESVALGTIKQYAAVVNMLKIGD